MSGSASNRSHVRLARQVLVLGAEGQAAVSSARARVGGGTASARVATTYAERAGFAGVDGGAIDRDALAPTDVCGSDAARDVLAASRAVLSEMRRATPLRRAG